MAVRRIPGSEQGAAGGGEETKVSGGRRRCQGRRPPLRAECSASVGRGGSENVTCGCSRRASAGPIPFTRCKPSSDPNGPCAARSSTMRAASAGPIPGRRSRSAAAATSRSTMSSRVADVLAEARSAEGRSAADADVRGVGRRPPAAMAESTRAICNASAARSAGGASAGRSDATPRTATPSAATAATNRRARCSAGVGTPKPWFDGLRARHPFIAVRRAAFRRDPASTADRQVDRRAMLIVAC